MTLFVIFKYALLVVWREMIKLSKNQKNELGARDIPCFGGCGQQWT